jgi:N-acetylneuraminate synthase
MTVKIIAEIGINHNGSVEHCKEMISLAKRYGADYAKIQKRNPDLCVPEEQKSLLRETPWGRMTYLEYKWKIEFSEEQIKELVEYAEQEGIEFFASVWDLDSVDLMARHTRIGKIASAMITNHELCRYARQKFDKLIISTGMSTEREIELCVQNCAPDVIMHTNSTYPCPPSDINLNYLYHLRHKWPTAEIGYSGHEFGLVTTFAAVAMGAQWVERHITLDRNMWGSDQLSSVEPIGLMKLVKGIRDIELAQQYPVGERVLFDGEREKRDSLRGKGESDVASH